MLRIADRRNMKGFSSQCTLTASHEKYGFFPYCSPLSVRSDSWLRLLEKGVELFVILPLRVRFTTIATLFGFWTISAFAAVPKSEGHV